MTKLVTRAELWTIAKFPINYFLENLSVRADNSLLITVLNHKELWYVPPYKGLEVDPLRLCKFDEAAMGIVEIQPDIFLIATSNLWTDHRSVLHRLDMRNWAIGSPLDIRPVFEFPSEVRGLNGACVISRDTILVADSFAGLIWRVRLTADATAASADVWMRHESMESLPDGLMPDQPGINGLAYGPQAGYVYYTSTARQLFMRVRVEPMTGDVASEPEFIADGMMGDDLCIDEDLNVAYIATHRQNTIDRVVLEVGLPGRPRDSVVGQPFTEELLGPTTGRWGRGPGDVGKTAFFLTDGGIKAPMPDGSLREARVLQVQFKP
ncbi:hypothetical protein [Paraburkholderia caribensis]|uniref:hypothetical protein n=1 Tax=Paraburkholderia caribensis TaxID=75105 RepID=UPI001CAD5B7D|nr:hypothetical protein [Paraburkholderia caribensis]CAG9243872.1 conserved hypothetical protein [Paraburkholderia caribensis]